MLSRRMMSDDVQARNEQWLGALLAAVALFAVLVFVLLSVAWPTVTADAPSDAISQLGQALVDPEGYVLVFEVASILLLAALVGAIVIARER